GIVFRTGSSPVRWTIGDEATSAEGTESVTDRTASSDAEGKIDLRFAPPPGSHYSFSFEARLHGYAGVAWSPRVLTQGEIVDLGEVMLLSGGTVVGSVVDADGNLILGKSWTIHARSIGLSAFEDRDETDVSAAVDPRTGHFRAEDVMPGRVEVVSG